MASGELQTPRTGEQFGEEKLKIKGEQLTLSQYYPLKR